MRQRKRITYRPNKAGGVFVGVVGILFVILGVTVVIPNGGIIGVIWTLMALGITIINFYQAFGEKYVGPEIYVEEDGAEQISGGTITDAQARLEQLQSLLDAELITKQEYEEKREEILRGL